MIIFIIDESADHFLITGVVYEMSKNILHI